MKTRFNISDSIVFMKNNVVCEKAITGISTFQGKIQELNHNCDLESGKTNVVYHCGSYNQVKDEDAFATIDDLKQSLFSNIEK